MKDYPFEDPKTMKKKPRGSYVYHYSPSFKVVVTKWHDNSMVTMGSNCQPVMPIKKGAHYSQAQRERIEVNQPQIVSYYNRNMGGVDRMDIKHKLLLHQRPFEEVVGTILHTRCGNAEFIASLPEVPQGHREANGSPRL